MNLPIDLSMKTMTNKVSVGAYDRLRELAEKHGFKIQDVLSACILHMPEDKLVKVLTEQQKKLDTLPKPMKAMLKNIDKLSEKDRAMLRDMLS